MFRLRSYVKEYEMRESVDNRGNVKKVPVYIGPWFIPTAEEEMRQRLKRIYAVMAVLMIAVFLGCGVLENAGNRNMINALAYACSCFPLIYNLMGMIATMRLKDKIERREYDMSVLRMKHSATGIIVLYPIAMLAEIFSLFTVEKSVSVFSEIVYFILCITMILAAWLVRYLCRKYPYREQKN